MANRRKQVLTDRRPGRLVCVCLASGRIVFDANEKQKTANGGKENATGKLARW